MNSLNKNTTISENKKNICHEYFLCDGCGKCNNFLKSVEVEVICTIDKDGMPYDIVILDPFPCRNCIKIVEEYVRSRFMQRERKPTKLYHATTPKKAKLYRETGKILKPVRGFTTLEAAMCWSLGCENKRQIFLEINCNESIPKYYFHKLPDHHNKFGEAWWIDKDVETDNYKCVLNVSDNKL